MFTHPLAGGRASAVFGLQFGDEGKGQIVDLLAAEHDVVVRFNGGANAGHSVRIGEEDFALHLLPSGVLSPTTANVIANGVAVDAEALLEEIRGIEGRGVSLDGRLFLSDRAHLVLPWHRVEDAIREALAARLLPPGRSTGSTGRGIGPAYADRAHRDAAVRVGDLYRPDSLAVRLRFATALKNAVLSGLAREADVPFTPFDADALAAALADRARELEPFVTNTAAYVRDAAAAGRRILFEGANSALLDVDHGTYPYVTSSHGSPLGIAAGTGLPPGGIPRVIGVMKAYGSRVGNGPFPTALAGEEAARLRELGGEYGTSTGRPRDVGDLDLVLVRDAVRKTGATALALTGTGVLAGRETVRFATAYRVRGRVVTEVPAAYEDLFDAEPVYETMPGWPGPIGSCRRYADLPASLRAFVAEIGRRVAPVEILTVGPAREQALTTGLTA